MSAVVGIRQEDKSRWERRAPLTPSHVRMLRETAGLQFRVQPSMHRIFRDQEYADAGAYVTPDLSPCDVIFGVKEIPPHAIEPRKTYVFFSHTIKGQPHNMPMLRRLMELGCQLIDYERITDASSRRLVFFGRHAGLAGAIDTLWALGQRLAWEGIDFPFQLLRRAWEYHNLSEAQEAVRHIGRLLASKGIPAAVKPLVIGIAGYGNVSRGAQEILDLLPHEEIQASDVSILFEQERGTDRHIYKVVFREEDTVEPIKPGELFDLNRYYSQPEDFRSKFEIYLPFLTVLINAIFWDPRHPRLVTCSALKRLYGSEQPALRVIGDISCDIKGAIECTIQCTEPDNPVYVYNPCTGEITSGVAGKGPVILAVDILPTELPYESSEHFGESLLPFVPAIAHADYRLPFDECVLPDPIRRAVICYQGKLTPGYAYLQPHVERLGPLSLEHP